MEAIGGLIIFFLIAYLVLKKSSNQSHHNNSNSIDSFESPKQFVAQPSKPKTVKVKHVHKHIAPKEKKASRFSASLHCPKCRSFNVQVVGNTRKGFSVGKAVGGAMLTGGGIGTLAGFAGKKNKKPTFHCQSCGNIFKHRI